METPRDSSEQSGTEGFRPFAFGDLLERAFNICWHNAKTFVLIVLVFVVPGYVALFGSFFAFPWDLIPDVPGGSDILAAEGPGPEAVRFIPFGVLFAIGFLVSIVASFAAVGACLRTAVCAHAELPVDWKPAAGAGLRRTHSLLWVYLLTALLTTLVFAFVAAPGVVAVVLSTDWTSILLVVVMVLVAMTVAGLLWLSWALAPAVVMTEATRGWSALRSSYDLVRGRRWWTGAVLFTALAAQWVIGSIFTIPSVLIPVDPTQPGFGSLLAVQAGLSILPSFVYVPLNATVVALLYVDARVRKEGLTRETLRAELQSSLR